MQWGVGGVKCPGKKRYEGVPFNDISVTRGWIGGGPFSRKKVLYVNGPLHKFLNKIDLPPSATMSVSTSPPLS